MSLWAHIYLSGFVFTLFLSVIGADYSIKTGRFLPDYQNIGVGAHVLTALIWPTFWLFVIVYTIRHLGGDDG